MSSIPNPKTQPFDYICLIASDLRAEGKNTVANELLDAIIAIKKEREALTNALKPLAEVAERVGDSRAFANANIWTEQRTDPNKSFSLTVAHAKEAKRVIGGLLPS